MAARKNPGSRATRVSASSAETRKTKARKTKAAGGTHRPVRRPERRKSEPQSLRLRTIEPSFTVSDLERSVRFYTDVLGFTSGEQFKNEAGDLQGVMLKAGACQIGLSQDDWAKGRDRQRGVAVRIWCTTGQDVDKLAARAKERGATVTAEPTDEPWGGRSFSVDDPDGFHLTIYRE
jgi:lactoylglutathione lyase